MTKAQRVVAMGRVINACAKSDDKLLADAVRRIVKDLQEQERQHKISAVAEESANLLMKQRSQTQPT